MRDSDHPNARPNGEADGHEPSTASNPARELAEGCHDVGYKKTPPEHRYRPGKSGNPSGRPRRRPTPAEEFRQVARMPVAVTENGKSRKIPTHHAILIGIRRDALKGDPKARKQWLDLLRQYGLAATTDDIANLLAEDERLVAKIRKATRQPGSDGDNGEDK